MLPSTFVRQVAAGSCVGWKAHARWTTASASANSLTRSACWEARSTADHSVRAGDHSGIRRASPSTDPTCASSERRRTRLVPTLPVAPVTTILLPTALLTFGSFRPRDPKRGVRVPGRGEGTRTPPYDPGGNRRAYRPPGTMEDVPTPPDRRRTSHAVFRQPRRRHAAALRRLRTGRRPR